MANDDICKNWDNFKSEITITNGYAVVMFIDEFIVEKYPLELDDQTKLQNEWNKKLLDIRVFNKDKEYRVFRGDLGSPFCYSCIEDDSEKLECFEDEQYLDIDTTKTGNGFVSATGGGSYKLPVYGKGDIKVYIKNYIDYDTMGQAFIRKWRLTDIREEGDKQ